MLGHTSAHEEMLNPLEDFQRCTEDIRSIADADYAVFNLLRSDHLALETVAVSYAAGVPREEECLNRSLHGAVWPMREKQERLFGCSISQGFTGLQELISSDLEEDAARLDEYLSITSVVLVRLFDYSRNTRIGDFVLVYRKGRNFRFEHPVRVFADQISLRLENMRLRRDNRRLHEQGTAHNSGQCNEMLTAVLEGTGAGVWTWDIGTGNITVNDRWIEMTGYSRKELEPLSITTWEELLHPDDAHISHGALQDHFAGRTSHYDVEVRIIAKSGIITWVHDRGTVSEWNEDGSPARMHGTHIDITRRKLAEEELKEKEIRLSAAIEGTEAGIWDWNMNRNTVIFSKQWKMMLGYNEDEVENSFEGWRNLWHPDDVEGIEKAVNNHLAGKTKTYEVVNRLKHKDGSWRWIMTRGKLLRDENNTPYRWVGTNIDITSQKEAERKLRESEQNFRTFFETMNDMIMIGNREGEIFYTNPAVGKKLGYSRDELQDMHILDVHPETKREEAEQIFGEMFAGKRDACPLPLAAKDGSLVPVETRVWFGRWDGKDCVFGISKDLTAQQEALQKFNRLFQNNPALMAVSEMPERRFTDVNESFLRHLGFSREEVIGKTAEELSIFAKEDDSADITRRISENGLIEPFEVVVQTKAQRKLTGMFSGEIIRSQGRSYFLTVMVDV
ncbi:MAG: PAS domain S-box protein, partial [Fibrobacterota bacterium]